jgi:hypothetical protein
MQDTQKETTDRTQQTRQRVNRRIPEDRNTELSTTADRARGYGQRLKEASGRRAEQVKETASSFWGSVKDAVAEGTRKAAEKTRKATQGRSPTADLNRTSETVAKGTAEVSSTMIGAVQRATTTSLGVLKGFTEGLVSSAGQARLAAQKFDLERARHVADWDGHVDPGTGEVPDDTCTLRPVEGGQAETLDLNHAIETDKRLGNDRHPVFVVPLISPDEKRLTGCYVLVKGGGPVYHQSFDTNPQ